MRPPFIRLDPGDVERFGGTAGAAAAAIVLALIRWRCETPGPAREEDTSGHVWWRISLTGLCSEAGLTKDAARHALKKLEDDGAVAKRNCPSSDQTRAYRVTNTGIPLASQLVDLTRSDLSVGRSPTAPWEKSHGTVGEVPPALPLETFETKRDRAGARTPQPSWPASTTGKRQPAKCPDHPVAQHWCRRCQARATWDAEAAQARRAAVAAVREHDIAACDQCDHNGMRHVDAGRCRLHRNLDDLSGQQVVVP